MKKYNYICHLSPAFHLKCRRQKYMINNWENGSNNFLSLAPFTRLALIFFPWQSYPLTLQCLVPFRPFDDLVHQLLEMAHEGHFLLF